MEEIRFDPIERKEFFLAKLGGQEVTPPDAVTRIERYLQDIIDGNASTIPPVTRIEYYLAKISGADVAVPDPVTRTEYYLAKIAGMDVEPPDPITRLEYFLAQWIEAGGGVLETVTGTAPITLTNALAKAMVRMTQYGLCTQESTPTPSAPVPIKCNNGEIKFGKPLTIDSTRITSIISTTGTWDSGIGYCVSIHVTVGNKYAIRMTETDSDAVGTILRYGFTDSATPDSQQLSQWVRTTPQDTQYAELTADNPYLVIQMAAGKFADIISNGYIVVNDQSLWVDGTPEVLTVTDADSNTQTASMESLFAVDAYADEQEVIGGVVTHNVGVKALNGTEGWTISSTVFAAKIDGMKKPGSNLTGISTHFKGTNVSNANMPDNSIKITYSGSNGVVAIKSATYSTADDLADFLAAQYAAGTPVIIVYPLATPTTEQVAAQPLNTSEGTNTVNVTAEVSPIELEAEYMAVAP